MKAILMLRVVSRTGVLVSGSVIILTALAITIDIVLRKLFGLSIARGAMSELAGYVLAMSIAWASAHALIDRAHVRIDTLQILVPAFVRHLLDLLGLIVFAGAFGVLAWKAWGVALRSWELGSRSMTPLETPVAIPQFVWAMGWSFTVLVALVLSVAVIAALLRGDRRSAQSIAGTRSIADELEDHAATRTAEVLR